MEDKDAVCKIVTDYLDYQYELAQSLLEEAIDDRNMHFTQEFSKDIHLLEQIRDLHKNVLQQRYEDYKGEDQWQKIY